VLLAAAILLGVAARAPAHPGSGIVADAKGRVAFVDFRTNRILRLEADGSLVVLLEDPEGERLRLPHHLLAAPDDGYYTAGDADGRIWHFVPPGEMTQVHPPEDEPGLALAGRGGDPFAVAEDGSAWLWRSRQRVHSQILRVTREGRIESVAGGEWGLADGRGKEARLRSLHLAAFAWGHGGALHFTDDGTCVRRLTPEGEVTTIAGGAEPGYRDGAGREARFDSARGVAVAADGTVFVADAGNRRIRKVAPDGSVTTHAGSGERGAADGVARRASFSEPTGLSLAPGGVLFVLDSEGDRLLVRRIGADGVVTTPARAP
jgi:sugar lactone lactonase YvrE